jgi:hypothetical protein
MAAAEAQGVGAFTPYMTAANQALGGAYSTTAEAADMLRAADTRKQFADAQAAMGQAGGAAAGITSGIGQINQGLGYLDVAGQRAAASDTTGQFGAARQDLETGLGALATGQNMAAMSSQANLQPATAAIAQGIGGLTQAQQLALGAGGADFSGSQALLGQAAGQFQTAQPQFGQAQGVIGQGLGQGQQAIGMAAQAARAPGIQQGVGAMYGGALASSMAADQPGFGAAEQALSRGIGTLGGAAQGFDPSSAQSFMDPYRQQVIDETMKQINRQGQIAQQGLSAQAVRSGAFGGEREGVQRAEMQRNLMDQKASTIANLLSQGFSQSQAQGSWPTSGRPWAPRPLSRRSSDKRQRASTATWLKTKWPLARASASSVCSRLSWARVQRAFTAMLRNSMATWRLKVAR